MIVFQCPSCGAAIQVPDSAAGKKGSCPSCKARAIVPRVAPPPPDPAGPALKAPAERPVRRPAPAQAPSAPPAASEAADLPAGTGATLIQDPQGTWLQFQCPHCAGEIRVPEAAAGRTGPCPKCSQRFRVPMRPAPVLAVPHASRPSPVAAAPVHRALAPVTGPEADSEPASAHVPPFEPETSPEWPGFDAPQSAAETDEDEESIAELLRQQRGFPWGKVVAGVLLLGLCVAGGYMLKMRLGQLRGELTAEHLKSDQLPPIPLDREIINSSTAAGKELAAALQREPIVMSSDIMSLTLLGAGGRVEVKIQAGPSTALYRIDPSSDKALAKYLSDHALPLERDRLKELQTKVDPLLTDLKTYHERKGQSRLDLAEVRNVLGLTAVVKGFGYHVQASAQGQLFPCVYEDENGRIYFLLPHNTRHFTLTGKEMPKKQTPFAGEFQVKVGKTVPMDLKPPPPPKPPADAQPDEKKSKEAAEPEEMPEDMPDEETTPAKPAKKKPRE